MMNSEQHLGERKVMAGTEKIGTVQSVSEPDNSVKIDGHIYAIGDIAKNFVLKMKEGQKVVYTLKKIKDVETVTFCRPSGFTAAAKESDNMQKQPQTAPAGNPADNPDESVPDEGTEQETTEMNAEEASGMSGSVTITTHISTGPYCHFEMTVAESSGDRAIALIVDQAERFIPEQKRLQYLASLDYNPKAPRKNR